MSIPSLSAPTETGFPADPVAEARSLGPVIEAHREQMDAQRALPAPVVEGMVRLGILRAAVPTELGGPSYDPRTQVEVVEELSRLDGSVGWCAMIASAASFTCGFLDSDTAAAFFGPANACLAGQLAPTGRAVRVPGGYRVSGRFRFGSGSGHATMLLGGCLVYDGDDVSIGPKGRPEQRSALVRAEQVSIMDTWHTTGLWGTGSNDYVIDDVFVPEEHTWDPVGPSLRQEPLYRYPPLFLMPHCGVPLGIARAAIDAVSELAQDKELYPGARQAGSSKSLRDDPGTQEAVAIAEAKLAAARALTYATIDTMWAMLQAGERIPTRDRAMYRITMTWIHQIGKEIVESMYDTASASSIYRGNPLDRLMRDMLTGAQHRMVHPKLYRPAGRLLLGLDSGDPLV